MEEECVIFLSDTFEAHSQKLIIGLENTLCIGITLNMFYPLYLSHHLHDTVVNHDRVVLPTLECHEITYVDVTAESDSLITDRVFESQYHTDRDNHHGQSYRNT